VIARLAHPSVPASRLVAGLDLPLLFAVAALLGIGLVMVASASMDLASRNFGDPFHFFHRQVLFAFLGLLAGLVFWWVPLRRWETAGPLLLVLILLLLVVVLIPGVGRTVNGATRWIPLGVFNLQVSEPVKLLVVLYLSGYIVRHLRQPSFAFVGFVRPLIVLGLGTVLLLLQPDFGGAAIMLAIGMGMLFLAGAKLWQFLRPSGPPSLAGDERAGARDSVSRVARFTAFLDPWQDPICDRLPADPVADRHRLRILAGNRSGRQCAEALLPARGAQRFSVRGVRRGVRFRGRGGADRAVHVCWSGARS
jgi:cell division protein FtsW